MLSFPVEPISSGGKAQTRGQGALPGCVAGAASRSRAVRRGPLFGHCHALCPARAHAAKTAWASAWVFAAGVTTGVLSSSGAVLVLYAPLACEWCG